MRDFSLWKFEHKTPLATFVARGARACPLRGELDRVEEVWCLSSSNEFLIATRANPDESIFLPTHEIGRCADPDQGFRFSLNIDEDLVRIVLPVGEDFRTGGDKCHRLSSSDAVAALLSRFTPEGDELLRLLVSESFHEVGGCGNADVSTFLDLDNLGHVARVVAQVALESGKLFLVSGEREAFDSWHLAEDALHSCLVDLDQVGNCCGGNERLLTCEVEFECPDLCESHEHLPVWVSPKTSPAKFKIRSVAYKPANTVLVGVYVLLNQSAHLLEVALRRVEINPDEELGWNVDVPDPAHHEENAVQLSHLTIQNIRQREADEVDLLGSGVGTATAVPTDRLVCASTVRCMPETSPAASTMA